MHCVDGALGLPNHFGRLDVRKKERWDIFLLYLIYSSSEQISSSSLVAHLASYSIWHETLYCGFNKYVLWEKFLLLFWFPDLALTLRRKGEIFTCHTYVIYVRTTGFLKLSQRSIINGYWMECTYYVHVISIERIVSSGLEIGPDRM